jgi:hypothetical protein
VLSTLAVSLWSRRVSRSVPAGTNAASQWIWDKRARHVSGWTWKHTALGYAIHHASSVFWAMGYEAWSRHQPRNVATKAATVAALAYLVDYHVVPPRLSPGFENRISRPGMACVYASFALGLGLATLLRRRPAHSTAPAGARREGAAVLQRPRQHAAHRRRQQQQRP